MTDSRSFLPLQILSALTRYEYNPLSISDLFVSFSTIITVTFLVKNLVNTDTPDTFSETFIKNDKASVYQKLLFQKHRSF